MLSYVSGYDGSEVRLDSGPLHVGTAQNLRSSEWSYTLGGGGMGNAVRAAREVSVQLHGSDPAALDRALRTFERDVQAATPGEFVYCGEWRTRALVTGARPTSVYRENVSLDLTAVLLDGVWRRRHEMHVPIPAPADDSDGLELPYDIPYDLAAMGPPRTVAAGEWGESAVGLRVYGPASDPAVTIGANTYQVMRELRSGEIIEVDGIAHTVELVTDYGARVNIAADAVRGGGAGSGSYIFQPLPPGESAVSADGSFAFDVIWYEEGGMPPWGRC